jgi:Cu(I)/Ag(I) efflux system membrane protein CusA/SilA
MVDAAIVMIDNIHKQREDAAHNQSNQQVVIQAMQQVGPSIFFSLLIITLAFIPVFALEGTEGRLFTPLAYTKTYSMGFAALLAITLIPALAVLLIRGKHKNRHNGFNQWLIRIYRPMVGFALRWRAGVVIIALLSLLLTVPVFLKLGSEFMPPLNEGSILYMPTTLPGMSITEAGKILQTMDQQLKQFPEVERVFGKIGRSTSPTDPAPLSMVETVITLKPKSEWREGMDWDSLIAEMDEQLQYPGMPNIWWMPIQTRIEMMATGIRSSLGIKVFGDNLKTIEQAAIKIENLLKEDERTKPYTRSIYAERLTGGYFLDFIINRDNIARYGLTVDDVQEVLMVAVGGLTVTTTIEGRERYAVNLRYAREFRDNPDSLQNIRIPTPTGAHIPISQVATLEFVTGPPMLRNEDGQLVTFVFVDVNGLGIVDYVNTAKQVLQDNAELKQGVRIAWAGQFQYFERAKEKLLVLIPLTVLIIFILLYINHGSMVEASIILLTLPFSLIGAIWLLASLDYNLSIAVWVGMIALAGLAAEMGVLMMLYLDLSYQQIKQAGQVLTKDDLFIAIMTGASQRIRPMLMTSLASFIGLLPILWSTGAGADVMKRIAAPMVGGIASALVMVLIVLPVIYSYWRGTGVT